MLPPHTQGIRLKTQSALVYICCMHNRFSSRALINWTESKKCVSTTLIDHRLVCSAWISHTVEAFKQADLVSMAVDAPYRLTQTCFTLRCCSSQLMCSCCYSKGSLMWMQALELTANINMHFIRWEKLICWPVSSVGCSIVATTYSRNAEQEWIYCWSLNLFKFNCSYSAGLW